MEKEVIVFWMNTRKLEDEKYVKSRIKTKSRLLNGLFNTDRLQIESGYINDDFIKNRVRFRLSIFTGDL